jgi:cell division protein FtsB
MEDEVQMVAAMSIVTVALTSVRSNIRDLLARARSIAQRLAEARTELDWFRSTNQSLVAEIRDGSGLVPQDAPLARAKERLWLVEESLLHSMTTQQVHLQGREA